MLQVWLPRLQNPVELEKVRKELSKWYETVIMSVAIFIPCKEKKK